MQHRGGWVCVIAVISSLISLAGRAADSNLGVPPSALNDEGRAAYTKFLGERESRAFTISENGQYFSASGKNSPHQALQDALAGCNKAARNICRVYAVNETFTYSRYETFERQSKAALEALKKETFALSTYGNEWEDFRLQPEETLHTGEIHAPTPLAVPGVQTIKTPELAKLMTGATPPIIIDVLGEAPMKTLPGAYWIRYAGVASPKAEVNASMLAQFGAILSGLTKDDKAVPLVMLCQDARCWLSYNAAMRARDLGYTNVYWYRGGRFAWQSARLDGVTPVEHGSILMR